jgi:hypothetical protein
MDLLNRVRKLAPVVARKGGSALLAKAHLGGGPSPTRREGTVSTVRQWLQWIRAPTDIWYAGECDNGGRCTDQVPMWCLLVGSSFNAAAASVWDEFGGVVNCCPQEFRPDAVPCQTRYVEIQLCDTNDATLDLRQLDAAFDLLQRTIKEKSRLLVNCHMGASRSVAVAIYLLGRHYGRFDYEFWRNLVGRQRQHINVSIALRNAVVDAWAPVLMPAASDSNAPTADAGDPGK